MSEAAEMQEMQEIQENRNSQETQNTQNTQNTEEESLEILFASLEEIIRHLEQDDNSLEASFSLYQRGMELLKKCSSKIDAVEKQVQILDEYGESHAF